MNLGTIIFRTFFFYFFIMVMYRLMGKREIGQLGVLDLIVSILIAELVAISIDKTDQSILLALIPIVLLTVLQIAMAYFSIKETKLRKFLDGTPSVIIDKGKVKLKEMLKQRYNLSDLLTQLREKNYKSIDEVEYAVLETSGNLSVFSKEEEKEYFPLPLILDGKIETDTLKYINKDEEWLLDNLNEKLENIFYAFYKENNIYIIRKSELN